LRRSIQNKRRGLLTRGVCLLHDNTRPPHSQCREAIFELIWIGCFEPHSVFLNLAPSDYHLFNFLKKHMGEKKFSTHEEVKGQSRSGQRRWRQTRSTFFTRKILVTTVFTNWTCYGFVIKNRSIKLYRSVVNIVKKYSLRSWEPQYFYFLDIPCIQIIKVLIRMEITISGFYR
jgi:hypothetical protein